MSKKARHMMKSDSSDYYMGYSDGMKAAFEESELDAYYAGVGYGKKAAKDKHIGFNNDEERQQFEAGIRNKNKHFSSYRSEPPTLLERLIGKKTYKKEEAVGTYQRKKTKYIRNRVSKKKRTATKKRR